MNIIKILLPAVVFLFGASLIFDAARTKSKQKWIIKSHYLAGLFSMIWSLLTIIEELWGHSVSTNSLTAMKTYDSIFFGLGAGVLLTLWLSGQLNIKDNNKNELSQNQKQ